MTQSAPAYIPFAEISRLPIDYEWDSWDPYTFLGDADEATLDALANGANDYVAKPANVGSVTAAIQNVQNELLPKIKQFCTWTTRSNFGCLGNARCGSKCWTCSPDCSTPTNRGRNHATDFVGQDRPNARKGRNLK